MKGMEYSDTLIVWKFDQMGRIMRQLIGVLAKLEQTRAGVKAARDWGVKFGRKPKLSRQQIHHARKLIEGGQRCEKRFRFWKEGSKTMGDKREAKQ
jgi:DNA invertase Pin-like site-specific DNA recombinase